AGGLRAAVAVRRGGPDLRAADGGRAGPARPVHRRRAVGGRPMRQLIPHPILSLGVFVASILLSASLSPHALLLAAVMALATPQVMRALGIAPVRVRAPLAILSLTVRVAWDILRSNVAVAQILLGRRHERVSGFL